MLLHFNYIKIIIYSNDPAFRLANPITIFGETRKQMIELTVWFLRIRIYDTVNAWCLYIGLFVVRLLGLQDV